MSYKTTLLFSFFALLCFNLAKAQVDSTRMLQNLKELSSDTYEGRNTGERGSDLARAYIIEQLDSMNVPFFDSTYVQPFSFWSRFKKKKYDGKNIIGVIEGTTFPNQYIVVSAHYDHVGIKKGKIYNGADDNASGTCGALEIADYFVKNPPVHSVIIAIFDAEELGLQGARCFVDEPPVEQDSIILNINMDMVSRNKKNQLYICGTFHYPFLRKPLEPIIQQRSIEVLFGHDEPSLGFDNWTSSSDHGAFHDQHIPFLYFGVEDHKDYHKPTDDFERIQSNFYLEAVQVALESIIKLDQHWEHLPK